MLARRLLIVGGGGSFIGGLVAAFDAAKIFSSVTQTIPDNTATAVSFNSTEFDPQGYKSGNSFVVPAGKGNVPFLVFGGTYSESIKSSGPNVSAPTADMIMEIFINGIGTHGANETRTDPFQTSNPGQPVGYISTAPCLVVLQDGDVVTFNIYIDNSGTSMVFGHASSTSAQTWMAIVRLST